MIDASTVFAEAVKAALVMADKLNADRVSEFWQGYNNSKLNWTQKGRKFEYPMPKELLRVTADWAKRELLISDGPGFVVEPAPKAPWDIPSPQPYPEGYVEFVPAFGDCFYAGNSNVPDGTIMKHLGKDYRLVIIGARGSLVYVKLWVLVG